jgi:hypothetical protein
MNNPTLYVYESQNSTAPTNAPSSGGNTSIPSLLIENTPEEYRQLPDSAYSFDSTNYNSLRMSLNAIDNNSNQIDSFVCLSPQEIHLLSDSNLDSYGFCSNFGLDGYFGNTHTFTNQAAGIYCDTAAPANEYNSPYTSGSEANLTDRNADTYLDFVLPINPIASPDVGVAICALEMELPYVDFDYDAVYLGINVQVIAPTLSAGTCTMMSGIACMVKRGSIIVTRSSPGAALPAGISFFSETSQGKGNPSTNTRYYSSMLPEYYQNGSYPIVNADPSYCFNTIIDDNNYYTGPAVTSTTPSYKLESTVLDLSNADDYELCNTIAIIIPVWTGITGGSGSCTTTVRVTDVCLMYHKTVNLSDTVYSGLEGRIYNDTWNSRKDATTMITKPHEMVEHICRLENFSDCISSRPLPDWGYAYPTTPPINTGSFDALNSNIKNEYLPGACELFDENDGYTDQIKTALCRSFGFMNYIDSSGNESIADLFDFVLTGRGTYGSVSLGNVIDRNSIKITPFPLEKVYPELILNYSKDYGPDDFQKQIIISDTDQTAYNSSFVSSNIFTQNPDGSLTPETLPSQYAKTLWTAARALYYRVEKTQLKKIPGTITDNLWATGSNDDELAFYYLSGMLNLMRCDFLELKMHSSVVQTWNEGHLFTFTSPKHTGGLVRKCLLVENSFDVNPPYEATIKALVLPVDFTYYQTSGSLEKFYIDAVHGSAVNFLPFVQGSTYSWSFGDSTTSTSASPNHTYTAAGTYSVGLTVNGSGVSTKSIVVS